MRVIARLAQGTERFVKAFTAVLMVLMVFATFAQVLFRYFFDYSLAWTEEVGRYLFVWICLFGVSLGYRVAEHSGYESLVAMAPASVRRWLLAAVDVLVAVFAIVVAVTSRDLIQAGMTQLTSATQFPISYVYLAFPLSAVPTLIFVTDSLARRWRGKQPLRGEGLF